MPWKVRTPASNANGRKVRTVIDSEDPRAVWELLRYWIQNLEDGDKIVIKKTV